MQSKITPGALWPDNKGLHINAHGGGILYHDSRYYWFGEHKVAGELGNTAQVGVHVYSSGDLLNWIDEGIALGVQDDPASEITKGCILERPKVLFNRGTGKFVMWFHLEPKDGGYRGARVGVAVASCVTGPYAFLRSFRPNAGVWPINSTPEQRRPLDEEEQGKLAGMFLPGAPMPYYPRDLIFRRDFQGGQMSRDMTLFEDEDGRAYHIHASEDNGTLHISQLSEDYLSPKGRYIRVFPGRFHEAPAIMKSGGRYYLITSDCTGWAPNTARLSVADSIWGPWTELGNPCLGSGAEIASTFKSQSTHILRVEGLKDCHVFLADRWNPENAIDGRYVWLPIVWRHGVPVLEWRDSWDLSVFG